jgi:hypothetical protein
LFKLFMGARPTQRDRLAQALLSHAFLRRGRHDALALLDEALQDRDEAICRGCAAAGQQLHRLGSLEASRTGAEIYERCLRAARDQGLIELDARLTNEHAQCCIDAASLSELESSFSRVLTLASGPEFVDLRHHALNNLFNVRLRRIRTQDTTAGSQRDRDIQNLIDGLSPHLDGVPAVDNWQAARVTHEILALAHASLSTPDVKGALRHGTHAIDLARRFGTFDDRLQVHRQIATTLAECGATDLAIAQGKEAAQFARLSALPLEEAQAERWLAHWSYASPTLIAEGSAIPRAIAHCRLAKRALEQLPSTGRIVDSARGNTWSDMAKLFNKLGDTRSAVECARRSVAAYEAAGDGREAHALRTFADRLLAHAIH